MLFTKSFQIYCYVSKQSLTNKNVWLKVFTKVFKSLSKNLSKNLRIFEHPYTGLRL